MSPSMLHRSTPVLLVAAAALGLIAWLPARAQEKGRPEHGQEKENALEGAMNTMKAELRGLSKGINADNRDKSLERIANFQKAVLAAKLETPDTIAKVEDAKKAEFKAGFRKQLIEVLVTSCKLETAVLDGKYDDAAKLISGDLKKLQDEGHEKYRGKEEH